jgi:hypothetical protein
VIDRPIKGTDGEKKGKKEKSYRRLKSRNKNGRSEDDTTVTAVITITKFVRCCFFFLLNKISVGVWGVEIIVSNAHGFSRAYNSTPRNSTYVTTYASISRGLEIRVESKHRRPPEGECG